MRKLKRRKFNIASNIAKTIIFILLVSLETKYSFGKIYQERERLIYHIDYRTLARNEHYGTFIVSPNSQRVAYIGTEEKKEFIVLDGKQGNRGV